MRKLFLHNNFLIEITSQVNKEQWNFLVKSVPEGTIFQTTYWADYLKERSNANPIYVTVRKKDTKEVLAIQLCFEESLLTAVPPHTHLVSILLLALRKVMPRYRWMFGPLILDKNKWEELVGLILKQLQVIARNNAISGTFPYTHIRLPQKQVRDIFLENGFEAKPWATFIIDLTLDEDALWDGLDRSAHRAIRRCRKEGVRVERIDTKDELKKYYKLLLETRKRLRFGLPPHFPNEVMWKHLKGKELIEVFVAKQNNKWLSALGIVGFNNMITELAVAQSNYSIEKKIYANDIIKWEIIKWGHYHGYKMYDLAGVSPNPKTKKEKGIYQFKAKWGGELVNYTVYNRRPLGLKQYFIGMLSFVAILIKRIKHQCRK